jgi:hypothetical protein
MHQFRSGDTPGAERLFEKEGWPPFSALPDRHAVRGHTRIAHLGALGAGLNMTYFGKQRFTISLVKHGDFT